VWHVFQVGDYPAGQFLRRGDYVGQTGINGAVRHTGELCRGWGLDKHDTGLFLEGAQPQRAVRPHAGKDHTDSVFLLVVGQRAKKMINRQAQAAGFDLFFQVQHTMQQGQIPVGRDNIDMLRLDPHPVRNLDNRHGRVALEQLHHHILVGRVQVRDYDEGQTAGGRYILQKQPQRLQPTGRSSNADYREMIVLLRLGFFGFLFLADHCSRLFILNGL